ncbi:MAG: hypothetical protein ACP5E4_00040, partial [Candidatus Aenigmatarchaeota archaeon]
MGEFLEVSDLNCQSPDGLPKKESQKKNLRKKTLPTNEERLLKKLERLQKSINDSLSKESLVMGRITKKSTRLDSKEEQIRKKKIFLEEAEAVKALENMQKSLNSAHSNISEIGKETSSELIDTYFSAFGIRTRKSPPAKKVHAKKKGHAAKKPAPKKRKENVSHHMKDEPAPVDMVKSDDAEGPFEGGASKPTGSEDALPEDKPDAKNGIPKNSEIDLSNIDPNNVGQLLKKLIEVNIEQQKKINELLSVAKQAPGDSAVGEAAQAPQESAGIASIGGAEGGSAVLEGMKNVERELTLDIPSLKIKDHFSTEKNVEEKVKAFEEKKKRKGLFTFKKEPDEKQKLKN